MRIYNQNKGFNFKLTLVLGRMGNYSQSKIDHSIYILYLFREIVIYCHQNRLIIICYRLCKKKKKNTLRGRHARNLLSLSI